MSIQSIRQHIPTLWFQQKRVKFTLEHALNVQTGSTSIALLFL